MEHTESDTTTALVTGASSGIGAALVRVLAERGSSLVVTARREDRLGELAAEIREQHGVRVDVLAHDLGAPGAARALHEAVAGLGVTIDVLVNNAGFGVYGKSWEQDLARLEQMMELNMRSLTVLTHLYCAEMVARGRGRILQVSSVGAYQPSPLYSVYAATKAYVLFMSQALGWELKGTGVTITTVCPGLTESEFHEVADHIKPKSMDALTMSARKVAEIAVKAMDKGRPVVTPGVMNKLMAGSVKLVPRSWATAAAGAMMQGKRDGS